MKKIYESPLHGWDESGDRIYIYELKNDEEYWKLYETTFEEKCDYFGVFDETGCIIAPGGVYYTYEFKLTSNHMIIIETMAYNV